MTVLRHRVETEQIDSFGGYDSGPHAHDWHQLSYAETGAFTIDAEGQRWVVPPHRAVWIPAGVSHVLRSRGLRSSGQRSSGQGSSGPSRVNPVYVRSELGFDRSDEILVVGVGSLLRALIDRLHHQAGQDERERYLLEELFLLQLDRIEARPLQLPRLRDPRLVVIQTALDHYPADGRTLKEWGQRCGASERTLVRLFGREAGMTFGHWRTQLRLQHALMALAEGDSVTSTAHACGYSSTSAFIGAFRLAFGTTPGRYFAS